jgi:hypothetical protein
MACAVLVSATTFAAEPLQRIGRHERWLVDQQGRVLVLHGGNLQLPGSEEDGAAPDSHTPQLMADRGFNGVRLVTFFGRPMPKPGVNHRT